MIELSSVQTPNRDRLLQTLLDAMRDEMLQSMAQHSTAAEKLRQMLKTQLDLLGLTSDHGKCKYAEMAKCAGFAT
eukprot:1775605-Amphidinium_carterae.1